MVSFRPKRVKRYKVSVRVIRGKRVRLGVVAPGIINRSRRRRGRTVSPDASGVGAVTS